MVVILGLGRFGMALGEELVASGVEVLGVDEREDVVKLAAPLLTHVSIADTTNADALRQLSVHEASRVVIGIGSNMGASLLTASTVLDLGVPNVWAKADNVNHAKILSQIGVHHVIRPDRDTGRRIAHVITGRVEEYAEFDRDFAMVKVAPPVSMLGRPIEEAPGNVSIVAIRPAEGSFRIPQPGTIIHSGDLVIAAGSVAELEKFGSAE
ncbi:potassium channel family protein [Corynebacterium mendelii]|uniref:TrkA family potassium uptake protein n=1 Tax=Corynebacterium mendelii TaxID=2765362 RepID=A0A939IYV1_9CORY|nr:TrkA family potassium uptake protein [Corynebacterium mendelii]MBN9645052.1 TrkA family potassium uptake protein [Corynebacterium mendelii]